MVAGSRSLASHLFFLRTADNLKTHTTTTTTTTTTRSRQNKNSPILQAPKGPAPSPPGLVNGSANGGGRRVAGYRTRGGGSGGEKKENSSGKGGSSDTSRNEINALRQELRSANARVSKLEAQIESMSPDSRREHLAQAAAAGASQAQESTREDLLAALNEKDEQIAALSYDVKRFRSGSPVARAGNPAMATRGRRRLTTANEAEMSEIRMRRLQDEKAVLMEEIEMQDEVLRAKDRQLELLDGMIVTLQQDLPGLPGPNSPGYKGPKSPSSLSNSRAVDWEAPPVQDWRSGAINYEDETAGTSLDEIEAAAREEERRNNLEAPLSPVHIEAIRAATSEATKEAREAAARTERQVQDMVQEMRSELRRFAGGGGQTSSAVAAAAEADAEAKKSSTPPPAQSPPLPPTGGGGASRVVVVSDRFKTTAAPASSPFAAMLRSKDPAAKEFEAYLQRAGRGQNLLFWRKCVSLRAKYRDKQPVPYSDAHEVYRQFMAPGSMMVSLPPEILGGVRDILQTYGRDRQHEGVPCTTFAKAEEEALRLLEFKYYEQFQASKDGEGDTTTTQVEVFSQENPMRLAPDTPPVPHRSGPAAPATASSTASGGSGGGMASSRPAVPRPKDPPPRAPPSKDPRDAPPAVEKTMVEPIQSSAAEAPEPPPAYSFAAPQKGSSSSSSSSSRTVADEKTSEERAVKESATSKGTEEAEPAEFTEVESLVEGPTLLDNGWQVMQVEKVSELVIIMPAGDEAGSASDVHMELTALLSADEIRTLREEFCNAVEESREAVKEAARAKRAAEKAAARKAKKIAAFLAREEGGAEEKKDAADENDDDDDDDDEEGPEGEEEGDPEDGELNCDEFVALVQRLSKEAGQRPMPVTKLQKVYVDADEDGNGMLDIDEFIELYKKVKKGDGPEGLSAPTNTDDDLNAPKVEYNIKDLEVTAVAFRKQDAFRCVYEPAIDGEAELSVEIGGQPVPGSPFKVFVYPPPLRFSSSWMSTHNVALKDNDMVVLNTDTTDEAYTCAWPSLLRDRPMWWKLFIEKLGSGCYLGIIGGDHHPHDKAHDTHDAFCWQNTSAAWMAGEPTRGHQGWKGFENGDECVFKYHPEIGKLMLQLPARIPGKTFMLDAGPPSHMGVRVLVNIRCFKDVQIRLAHASVRDWNEASEMDALSKS
jgi:hypothetical protein